MPAQLSVISPLYSAGSVPYNTLFARNFQYLASFFLFLFFFFFFLFRWSKSHREIGAGGHEVRNFAITLFDQIRTDPPVEAVDTVRLLYFVVWPNTNLYYFATDEFQVGRVCTRTGRLITAITWSFCYVFPATWPPKRGRWTGATVTPAESVKNGGSVINIRPEPHTRTSWLGKWTFMSRSNC